MMQFLYFCKVEKAKHHAKPDKNFSHPIGNHANGLF